jgi:predicted O-methyltransferase YrrM
MLTVGLRREALEVVEARFPKLPYMQIRWADKVTELIERHDLTRCLELGCFQGKSTAFIAAALRVLGRGHLTTIDRLNALERKPNVHEVLHALGLEPWVTVHLEPRSLTWRLMRMLETQPQPRFDFVYMDAGHTWDVTGFAFLLVDRLLEPGGFIIFDDLEWTLADFANRLGEQAPARLAQLPLDERTTPQVGKVWELLVAPDPGYKLIKDGKRGIARKRRRWLARRLP